jgi:hypothetical protein
LAGICFRDIVKIGKAWECRIDDADPLNGIDAWFLIWLFERAFGGLGCIWIFGTGRIFFLLLELEVGL